MTQETQTLEPMELLEVSSEDAETIMRFFLDHGLAIRIYGANDERGRPMVTVENGNIHNNMVYAGWDTMCFYPAIRSVAYEVGEHKASLNRALSDFCRDVAKILE